MQIKFVAAALLTATALSACTTRPVTVNTPGPGATTVQVPVVANSNMLKTDDVRAALDNALGTNAAGIDVKVDGATVYLTGHVATQALHNQAISVAQGTPGVGTVVHTGLMVH